MDYNQQRRYRNGYGGGRQMNDARGQASGDGSCGCHQGQRGMNYDGRQGQRNRNYDHSQRQQERNYESRFMSPERDCGCRQERMENERGYRQDRMENDCGCRQERRNDGCTCQRQKGCLEESYPIGMGYIPWQSWNCTYDAHRGLMSGTIFPELDKPFCAAGRCRQ